MSIFRHLRARTILYLLPAFILVFSSPVNAKEKMIVEADPVLDIFYEDGYFRYEMPNGAGFTMNCPLGGIIDEGVELTAGNDSWIVSLLEDGESVLPSFSEYHSVSEALAQVSDNMIKDATLNNTGSYLFHIRSSTTDKTGRETYDVYGGFRIAVNSIPLGSSYIEAPYGYETGKVYLNGRETDISGKERVELTRDGSYEIHYIPLKKGLPEWVSSFTRDTTAPALKFSKDWTGDPVEGPISFYPTESNARISVLLNNKETGLYNMTAAANGHYTITVSDSAGNSNEYSFNLKMKETTSPLRYLVILLVLIAAALIIVLSEHRRMRII